MDIESIKARICDEYCKYPEEYSLLYEDKNVAFDTMLNDICADCPLNDLEEKYGMDCNRR